MTVTGHSIGDISIGECQEQLDAFVKERWPHDFDPPVPAVMTPQNGHQGNQRNNPQRRVRHLPGTRLVDSTRPRSFGR